MIHFRQWVLGILLAIAVSMLGSYGAGFAQCVNPGTSINFNTTGNNTTTGYTTTYVLTDASGSILQTVSSGFQAPSSDGTYKVYAVNYSTSTSAGNTAPTLTAGTNIASVSGSCVAVSNAPITFCVSSACIAPGTSIAFNTSGNNTSSGYITRYVMTNASGTIIANSSASPMVAPSAAGTYSIYVVNYSTSTAAGSTAPTLTNGTNINATGGSCVATSNSPISFSVCAVTASTPVASVGNNPSTPGTSTGSISLSASTGSYPANTPVSVTYTSPSGQATYSGTTDGSGKITIPNLPAGSYGPFTVSVNGGTPSSAGGSVTLTDPAPASPIASVANQPSTPGTSTGSISLSASTGSYPANTPVSVTYTTSSGSATYTGTTDGSGKITIPNLPAGSYGPFTVSVNGGTPSTPGGSVTLVDPAPSTCVQGGTTITFSNSGNNTASGYTTTYALVDAYGSIVSTATATSVAAPYTAGTYSVYVVNYSTASGNTAPTLTAGTSISAIGGTCVATSSSPLMFTVCVPTIPDLTPTITALPTSVQGTKSISVLIDVVEINNIASSGTVRVYVSKDSHVSLSFDPSALTIGGQTVQNGSWTFDGNSNPNYYILTTSQVISGGGALSFGFTGTLTPGATKGQLTISTVILGGSGNENRVNNNVDADKIDYFP